MISKLILKREEHEELLDKLEETIGCFGGKIESISIKMLVGEIDDIDDIKVFFGLKRKTDVEKILKKYLVENNIIGHEDEVLMNIEINFERPKPLQYYCGFIIGDEPTRLGTE